MLVDKFLVYCRQIGSRKVRNVILTVFEIVVHFTVHQGEIHVEVLDAHVHVVNTLLIALTLVV